MIHNGKPLFSALVTSSTMFDLFTIPSISALLWSTGEFKSEKSIPRNIDTGYILAEFLNISPYHSRSSLSVKRLNSIHARYTITNDEFMWLLNLFYGEIWIWKIIRN